MNPDDLLTHSPADIVRWLMVALGMGIDPASGTSSNWPIFQGSESNAPDNVITTYNTTGQGQGVSLIDGEVFTHYGFQVRVRSGSDPEGYTKIASIRYQLARVLDRTVSIASSHYLIHKISNIGDPIQIGKDAPGSKRSLHTLNCTVVLTQQS